jgi:hypothetical protein
MVLIAVNAEAKIATIEVVSIPVAPLAPTGAVTEWCPMSNTAKIAANAIAVSPPTTTNRPVHARVCWTASSSEALGTVPSSDIYVHKRSRAALSNRPSYHQWLDLSPMHVGHSQHAAVRFDWTARYRRRQEPHRHADDAPKSLAGCRAREGFTASSSSPAAPPVRRTELWRTCRAPGPASAGEPPVPQGPVGSVAVVAPPSCTTTQYKSLTRQHIQSLGFRRVANFGDQFSDLRGGLRGAGSGSQPDVLSAVTGG